jgi:hypothetical protein
VGIIFTKVAFSQVNSVSSFLRSFPLQLIQSELHSTKNSDFGEFTGVRPLLRINQSIFRISILNQLILNNGHSNIDNNAEIMGIQRLNEFHSVRMEYTSDWFAISIEPYIIQLYRRSNSNNMIGTFAYLNNQYNFSGERRKTTLAGLRQSEIILHYRGIGIEISNASKWWGPGFHSSIALSSNAPGIETYSIGTFRDIRIKNISLGLKAIVSPYKSEDGNRDLYFSGIETHITIHSDPIITTGLFRTYLSMNYDDLSKTTSFKGVWKIKDALKLVFEPLFASNKTGQDYTKPGTIGHDAWDEILSGYVNLTFPKEHLKIYFEVSSDDNRGNLTDLKAHWDHTLGYLVGFRKYFRKKKYVYYIGSEYLSTKISNTLNPVFWRGDPNLVNYYEKKPYDYFTYKGRRMGAHSGSSSDDLIFMLGLSNEISTALFSFNKERHGVKGMTHPELKTEYVLTYHHKITTRQTAFITLEYEHIKNFGFIQNNISISKLIWLGYSFAIQ